MDIDPPAGHSKPTKPQPTIYPTDTCGIGKTKRVGRMVLLSEQLPIPPKEPKVKKKAKEEPNPRADDVAQPPATTPNDNTPDTTKPLPRFTKTKITTEEYALSAQTHSPNSLMIDEDEGQELEYVEVTKTNSSTHRYPPSTPRETPRNQTDQTKWEAVDPDTQEEWGMIEDRDGKPPLLIYSWGAKAAKDSVCSQHQAITNTLIAAGKAYNITDPVIVCPQLIPLGRVPHRPIVPFLAVGLDQKFKAELLERRVLATDTNAIFINPFHSKPTTFAFVLSGYPGTPNDTNNFKVASYIKAGLEQPETAPMILEFLALYNDNIPANIRQDPKASMAFIVDSVVADGFTLRTREGAENPTYRVYIHPPTSNTEGHNLWINGLNKLKFRTPLGTAHTRPTFRCNLCKGLDHPTGLCPFPLTPGWNIADPHATQPRRPAGNGDQKPRYSGKPSIFS
ncbi:hypothetical protein CVT24_013212 [Panaeolus cyanescens]|uniref:Uncharacterized protein n=1 Tax=Panaeolus cyanescens TaxID=181874 RepID=A0A409YMU6_9AGAR|nr:hypothetical protein CVT24_013212 [Panaeolus cyanescens]